MTVVSERFSTEDEATAEAALRHGLPEAHVGETGDRFHCTGSSHGGDGIVLTWLRITSSARVTAHLGDGAVFGLVLHGDCTVRSGGAEIDPARPFVLGPGHVRLACSDDGVEAVLVSFTRDALRGGAPGQPEGPVAHGHLPRSAAMDAVWARALRTAQSVLTVPALLADDLVRAATLEMLREAAVATFDVRAAGEVSGPSPLQARRIAAARTPGTAASGDPAGAEPLHLQQQRLQRLRAELAAAEEAAGS